MDSRFEEFLKEWHAKDYVGTDDDMPDSFDSWLGDLDIENIIRMADIAILDGEKRGLNRAAEIYSPSTHTN